jgi:hypothetical protein
MKKGGGTSFPVILICNGHATIGISGKTFNSKNMLDNQYSLLLLCPDLFSGESR